MTLLLGVLAGALLGVLAGALLAALLLPFERREEDDE